MFRVLAGLPPGGTTPDLADCPIVKTHSFRPDEFAGAGRAFFMFGDPVASVVSTRLNRFDPKHFQNCGAGDLDPEATDIYGADLLNYERMFDSWTRRQTFDVMCLRYETLYDNVGLVSEFLGRDFLLPKHRPRNTTYEAVDSDTMRRIRETYAGLIAKVERAPDVAVYRPKGAGLSVVR